MSNTCDLRNDRNLSHLRHLETFEGVMCEVRGKVPLRIRNHFVAEMLHYVPGRVVDVLLRDPQTWYVGIVWHS